MNTKYTILRWMLAYCLLIMGMTAGLCQQPASRITLTGGQGGVSKATESITTQNLTLGAGTGALLVSPRVNLTSTTFRTGSIVRITNPEAAPTGLTPGASSFGQVNLRWDKVVGMSGYRIYRNGVQIATIADVNTTQYTDLDVSPSARNTYCVDAFYLGQSFINARETGYACATGETKPNDFTASVGNSDGIIKLKWNLYLSCLSGTLGESVYLSVRDDAQKKEVYKKIYSPEELQTYRVQENFKPQYTLEFTGSGDWTIPYPASVSKRNYTLELLVKRRDLECNQIVKLTSDVVLNINSSGAVGDGIKVGGTLLESSSGIPVAVKSVMPYDRWTMVSLVSKNGNTEVYFDGKLKGVVPQTLELQNLSGQMKGFLGQMRIWSRARTAEEILSNYDYYDFTGNESDMAAIWKFDQAAGSTVSSLSKIIPMDVNGAIWSIYNPPTLNNLTVQDGVNVFADESASRSYSLKMFKMGSGTETCTSLTATGSTTAYKQLNLQVDQSAPEKITLSWTSDSDLATKYNVYRDNKFVGSVEGNIQRSFIYTDSFQFTDPTWFTGGRKYTYCVKGYSSVLRKEFAGVCIDGTTASVPFTASDNAYPDKVMLSWSNVEKYADTVQVLRDGKLLAYLPASRGMFTDPYPVFGKRHSYALYLLSKTNSHPPYMAYYDEGGVAANGLISGRVITDQGDWAMANVAVTATATINGVVSSVTAKTDAVGFYSFPNLFYEEAATYTITASMANRTFKTNPQKVNLTRSSPRSESLLFEDTKVYEELSSTDIQISNLTMTQASDINALAFTWSYNRQPGIVTIFNIYRDDNLIGCLHDQAAAVTRFEDTKGTPGTDHRYRVVAYFFTGSGRVNFASSMPQLVRYPVPATPTNLVAIADTEKGVVNLSWNYTSDDFDGFQLKRDAELIGNVEKNVKSFTDKKGIPSRTHTYSITAFTKSPTGDGTAYSEAALVNAQYPTLPPPATVTSSVMPETQNDRVKISWTYGKAATYNYDGFNIYRNNDLIGYVGKDANSFEMIDKYGVPGTASAYGIKAVLKRDDQSAESVIAQAGSLNFPAIRPPSNLSATPSEGQIKLTWNYDSENIDGFEVLNGTTVLGTLPNAGARSFIYCLDPASSSGTVRLGVRAFAKRSDATRYSTVPAIDANSPSNMGSGGLQAPSMFLVSNGFSSHVQLLWEFPEYIYANFELYRDGSRIANLDKDQRIYYDATAEPGIQYVYKLRAVNTQGTSPWLSSVGQRVAYNSIRGLVLTNLQRVPLAGVEVIAKSSNAPDGKNIISQKTYTDSTGYFEFKNLDASNFPVTVSVYKVGKSFVQSSQEVSQSAGQDQYKISFYSNQEEALPAATSSVAAISAVSVLPDPSRFATMVRWAASGDNYSGFRVFRDFSQIAEIAKGKAWEVIDLNGVPGAVHAYSVQAYWDLPSGTEESKLKTTTAVFPVLYPVTYFIATPLPDKSAVELTWSHEKDNHTQYEVYREGNLIGTVATKTPLKFADLSGIPGRQYNYEVRAVLVNTKVYKSNPLSAQASYPYLAPVASFTSEVLQNSVLVKWEVGSATSSSGVIIRRNGTELAKIPHTEKKTQFVDKTGIPESQQEYSIVTYIRNDDGLEYESKAKTTSILFPRLASVTGLTSSLSNLSVKLNWTYPEGNVDGFYIYRGGQLYQTLTGISTTSFEDLTGNPGTNYEYKITAFAKRGAAGLSYQSLPATRSAQFPALPAPADFFIAGSNGKGLVAIFGIQDYATLKWSYGSENNDGFELFCYESSDGSKNTAYKFPRDARKGTIISTGKFLNSYSVRCRAYKDVNGVRIYSEFTDQRWINSVNIPSDQLSVRATGVSASDALLNGKVRIDWKTPASLPTGVTISKFKIYRDGIYLTETGSSTEMYQDMDVVAGKQYVYSVVTVVSGAIFTEAPWTSDFGSSAPNGVLKGGVYSEKMGSGLGGVTVTATASIENQKYTASTTTDSKGDYVFNGLYYGNAATYTVSASFLGHDFKDNGQQIQLNATTFMGMARPIFDQNALLIRGKAYQPGVRLGLDGVEVTLKTVTSNVAVEQKVKTDNQGMYSFAINPYQEGIKNYEISIANTDTKELIDPVTKVPTGLTETTSHDFSGTSPKTLLPENLKNTDETIVNFKDIKICPVAIRVGNSCGPIGNYRWKVRVQDERGAYDSTFFTDVNGNALINLPVRRYFIRVIDDEFATARLVPILDYFKVRPARADLKNWCASHPADADGKITPLPVDLLFHQHPIFTIRKGDLGDRYLCDSKHEQDYSKGVILDFNTKSYTLNVSIREPHFEASMCLVNEGYLLIRNSASTTPDQLVRVDYNTEKGGFNNYTFEKGIPNLIAPYKHTLVIQYFTDRDGFLGQYIVPVIVEGIGQVPGTDVIVNPTTSRRTGNSKNLGGTVQLPLMILRDPPGDNSYSYVKKGTSFSKTYSYTKTNSGGFSAGMTSSNFFFFAGTELNAKVITGGSGSNSHSMKVQLDVNETVQTSGLSTASNNLLGYLDGRDADVIVGMGVAMQYGLSHEIKVNAENNCTIEDQLKLTMSPSDINTTWTYTVSHIDNLIKGYEKLEKDLKSKKSDLNGLELRDISTVKNNWIKVLDYHKVKTTPEYRTCKDTKNYLEYVKKKLEYEISKGSQDKEILYRNFGNSSYRKKLVESQKVLNDFCDHVYPGGKIDDEKYRVTWDQDAIDKYNVWRATATNYKEFLMDLKGGVSSEYQKELLFETYDTLINMLNIYGAENITFSANAPSQHEITTTTGTGSGLEQSVFVGDEVEMKIVAETKMDFKFGQWIGFGAGVSFEADVTDGMTVKLGAAFKQEFKFELKESTSIESTKTYSAGYVLSDDDDGDQFSVTVIQNPLAGYSPYFSLLGGRSSCPYESGTIPRDHLKIELGDEAGNIYPQDFYRLDPSKQLRVPVKVSSRNEFGESRPIRLVTSINSNKRNLKIFAQSAWVTPTFGPLLFLPPDKPMYMEVFVDKSPLFYDYDDIFLVARPTCVLMFEDKVVMDSIKLSFHYRKPCSPVSIVEPGDNFTISKAMPGQYDKLNMKLTDFIIDTLIAKVKQIRLEYKNKEATQWEFMDIIPRKELLNICHCYELVYPMPTYRYEWNVDKQGLADGTYQIRAVADCGTDGVQSSNIVTGVIDRTPVALKGLPSPADGTLNMGEDIYIDFTEMISCYDLTEANYTFLKVGADGSKSPLAVSIECSGNRITFKPRIDLNTMKGATIEVMVKDVKDTRGNVMINPVTWSFVVDVHPLRWNPEQLEIEVYRGDKVPVSVNLSYAYPKPDKVRIDGYPDAWMTRVNSRNVPIARGESEDLTSSGLTCNFVIDASKMTPGVYRETIKATLSTTQYGDRLLPVKITVTPQPPVWKVDPAMYEANMSLMANYKMDGGEFSSNTMDIISVWIDKQLRGVAKVSNMSGNYVSYLAVYGSASDMNKPLEFRVWNASSGIEYSATAAEALTFDINKVYGTTRSPKILNVNSGKDLARFINVKAGWNWISFNALGSSMSVSNLLGTLESTPGDILKTQTSQSIYTASAGWYSTDGLSSVTTVDGYWLYSQRARKIRITGSIDPNRSITLKNGWTLIGNPNSNTRSVDEALLIPGRMGKVIKSDEQIAEYLDNKWQGSLTTLEPGKSYMLLTSAAGGLQFNGRTESDSQLIGDERTGFIDVGRFEHNMSLVATFNEPGLTKDGDVVAAYSGTELRGYGIVKTFPLDGKPFVSMLLFGDTASESMRFIVYQRDKKITLANVLSYQAFGRVGTYDDPYLFNTESVEYGFTASAHPNPASNTTSLKIDGVESGVAYKVKIMNAQGIVVRESLSGTTGSQNPKLDIDLRGLAPGVYEIVATFGTDTRTLRIVKL